MRKFLVRWWYTANWERETYRKCILNWNGAPLEDYFLPQGYIRYRENIVEHVGVMQ